MSSNKNESTDPLRDKLRSWKLDGEILEEVYAQVLIQQKAAGKKAKEKAEADYLKNLARKEAYRLIGKIMGLERQKPGPKPKPAEESPQPPSEEPPQDGQPQPESI